jgi:hypothetical protein
VTTALAWPDHLGCFEYRVPDEPAGLDAKILLKNWLDATVRLSSSSAAGSRQAQRSIALHPLTRSVASQLDRLPPGQAEAARRHLTDILEEVNRQDVRVVRPLRLAILDDGSALVEWTFPDRRFGFSFEREPGESGWYFVYSSGSSERYESGTMDQLDIQRMVKLTTQT